MERDIKKLISELTLEEKASLCSGKDYWRTKTIERLGIPAIFMSDGPSGLRTEKKGEKNDTITAISFPSGCATASSFDRELLKKEGEILGEESNSQGVAVLLGPAINIKRSPLCGRNFEYYSEDPYLAGELGAAYVNGIQSKNVGASVKHFAANNQEFNRLKADSVVDERTLHEIYLPAFEKVIKDANPKTVMCSYNKLNGTLASENKVILTDILREKWGYGGLVVSDWGAVSDRVEGIRAGLNLEMPGCGGVTDGYIVEAVKKGELDEAKLDESVEKVLELVFDYVDNKTDGTLDLEKDHELSGKIAEECCVLLKNDGDILPLAKNYKAAFIGTYAKVPRFEGGGSAHIQEYKLTGAIDAAEEQRIIFKYAQGWNNDGLSSTDELIKEAVETAQNAQTAIIFAGLPDVIESEGYDRNDMKLPEVQNKLIEKICEVQKNVVVVLHNGAPIEMPWINKVKSVLECYLGGENIGTAQIRLLYGDANPSGKLAETFPLRLEDNPSYLNFPGNGFKTNYAEGIFVGYRYYEKKKHNVLFPFGHGLSYTTFSYSNLAIEQDDAYNVKVSVDIMNTGMIFGKEIAQLYIADKTGFDLRPEKELKGFEKIPLDAGETKTVTFILDKRSFAYYNTDINDWYVPGGEYEILIGASSNDIRLAGRISLKASVKCPFKIDRHTAISDLLKNQSTAKMGKELYDKYHWQWDESPDGKQEIAVTAVMQKAMFIGNPLRSLRGQKGLTDNDIDEIIEKLNKECE